MPGDIARRMKVLERRSGTGTRRHVHELSDGELFAAVGLRDDAGRLRFNLSDDELQAVALAHA